MIKQYHWHLNCQILIRNSKIKDDFLPQNRKTVTLAHVAEHTRRNPDANFIFPRTQPFVHNGAGRRRTTAKVVKRRLGFTVAEV